MALNRCVFFGRMVRDTEVKRTPNGVAVVSFTIAVQRNSKNQETGGYDADFIDCVAWRNVAEYMGRNVAKGQCLNVEGRLQVRKWVDKTGQTRKTVEIIADNVYSCGGKPKNENENNYDEHGNEKFGDFSELEEPGSMDELPF